MVKLPGSGGTQPTWHCYVIVEREANKGWTVHFYDRHVRPVLVSTFANIVPSVRRYLETLDPGFLPLSIEKGAMLPTSQSKYDGPTMIGVVPFKPKLVPTGVVRV